MLFRRAFKDISQLGKKYLYLLLADSIVEKSVPFIGYIYMTRIVDALTRDAIEVVPRLIVQYLALQFIFQLLSGTLKPLKENEQVILTRNLLAEPNKKMLTMHFHYAESSDIRERLELLNRSNMNAQSSLPMIAFRLRYIIPELVTVIWSLIILIPLFTIDRSELPEHLWWLSPIYLMAFFLLIMFISVRMQVNVGKVSGEIVQKLQEKMKLATAKFHYEYDIFEDVQSGKEIRLYQLTKKMIKNWKENTKSTVAVLDEVYLGLKKAILPVAGVFQLVTLVIYGYLGTMVLIGALSVALIIQLSNALSQLIYALPSFMQNFMLMIAQPKDLEEYYSFMDLPDEETKGSIPVEKRIDNEFELSIDNMTFTYPGQTKETLKNITERFEVGKKYAVVGENGSGKTTFVKLLTRLYEPTQGEIKVNRINASKYDLREYFDLFGVVFQDYHLLGFSIGQNISVSPSYDQPKVMSTLDKVGLGEFVQGLSNQANTYLGTEFDETGVNVSGGQGQKIAIARSLYKDAPIMILDEPTAALDPITEFEIYQNFDRLVEDKTAFYISHRLSSAKFCDEILVFDKGEIIQRGTHDELVHIEGKYQELWNAQAQYYQ